MSLWHAGCRSWCWSQNKERHSAKFSLHAAKRRERKFMRNPVWFLSAKKQIGFRIYFLSPASQPKRKYSGMTVLKLSNNIRQQLALDQKDFVAQDELAFFQALD